MGIPKYFRYLANKYSSLIVALDESEYKINHLFLDLNCLIHPCVRKIIIEKPSLVSSYYIQIQNERYDNEIDFISDLEDHMFKEIKERMMFIINKVNPDKTLYIGIDGVPPRAKMEQQRIRRYKAVLDKKMKKEIYDRFSVTESPNWDTNNITPGTIFMWKLGGYLRSFCNELSKERKELKIVFSNSDVPGEGEHKIMEYMRKMEIKDEICSVYGLDADLIMLSLLQGHKIQLLREAVHFGKTEMDDLLYFDISEFKKKIIENMTENIKEDERENIKEEDVIRDYILIGFLMGNDFLPKIISVDINDECVEVLIDLYKKMLGVRLNTIVKGDIIHFESIHGILNNYYYEYESKFLNDIEKKVNRWRPRLKGDLSELDKELEKLEYYPFYKHGRDSVEKRKKFLEMDKKDFEVRYYRHYFKIHSYIMDIEYVNSICSKYIEGIQWVFNYYIGKLKDWRWYYPWRNAPLLTNLCVYMNRRIYQNDFDERGPYKALEGLIYVLPPDSFKLMPSRWWILWDTLNHPIRYIYPIEYEIETYYKNMLWECEPILPNIEIEEVREYIKDWMDEYENRNSVGEDMEWN